MVSELQCNDFKMIGSNDKLKVHGHGWTLNGLERQDLRYARFR